MSQQRAIARHAGRSVAVDPTSAHDRANRGYLRCTCGQPLRAHSRQYPHESAACNAWQQDPRTFRSSASSLPLASVRATRATPEQESEYAQLGKLARCGGWGAQPEGIDPALWLEKPTSSDGAIAAVRTLPKPSSEPSESADSNGKRRMLARLKNGARRFQRRRVANCGLYALGAQVSITRAANSGRASIGGVAHCSSMHECIGCSAVVRTEYAKEVGAVVDTWGIDRVAMVTLTVRHEAWHDLRRMRKGVAVACTALVSGNGGKAFEKKWGIAGETRAGDVTHGFEHGWHTHVHILMYFDRELDDSERERFRDELSERWARKVTRGLGEECTPDDTHGVDVSRCYRTEYLTKLGLELTDPARGKRARGDHRSQWDILEDLVSKGRKEDLALWNEYVDVFRGTKLLTWRGRIKAVRKRLFGQEVTPEQMLERASEQELVALVPTSVWDAGLSDDPGTCCELKEVAESEGTDGVYRWLHERFPDFAVDIARCFAMWRRYDHDFPVRGPPPDTPPSSSRKPKVAA